MVYDTPFLFEDLYQGLNAIHLALLWAEGLQIYSRFEESYYA
jgi:hypothetical protein